MDPNDPKPPVDDPKPPVDDPKPPADPPPPAEEKFTVKVDGEDRVFTKEEAIAALAKVGGADKKFQEAAELRKQAERGMRIDSLLAKVQSTETPDEKDVNELAGLMNIDLSNFVGEPGPPPNSPPTNKKLTLDDFSPELKRQLEYDNQRNIENAEQKILNEITKGVDKDEILGKMNSVAKDAGNEDFLGSVASMVHEDVLRKIQRGESYGPDLISRSIQAARARLKKFGTPEKVSQPKTIIMGLGQPGGEPVSVQPDEPIKRKESSETGYADNFAKRAFQMLSKAAVSKT
jgi:hypothetical protein